MLELGPMVCMAGFLFMGNTLVDTHKVEAVEVTPDREMITVIGDSGRTYELSFPGDRSNIQPIFVEIVHRIAACADRHVDDER